MIYLLDGKETYFLAKKKASLLKDPDLTVDNITSFDGSTNSSFQLQEVLALCSMTSLFSEKRVVIIDNPYFLKAGTSSRTSTPKKKKADKDDVNTLLEEYCHRPTETTDLILYCYGYDADKRTKAYSILKNYENKTVKMFHFSEMSPYELETKINQELVDGKFNLDKDALEEFKIRIGNSTTEYYKALDKLDLYGKKNLNYTDIVHLIPTNPEVDIWKFGNAFLAKNYTQMMRSYYELTEIEKVGIIQLITMLASQIRSVYNCVVCYENYLSESEIKSYTGRYYPMKDIQSAKGRSAKDLLKILSSLADLDQMIKRGEVTDVDAFELFIHRSCN